MPASNFFKLTITTLARDAARLTTAGYRLVEIMPFDLLPRTYHIDNICIFEKP
jgi:hypothetical protein